MNKLIVRAVIASVNQLNSRRLFPSSQRRGGRAINKMDPFRNGAAGVVSSAKLFRPEDFAELTTPSAALSVASQLLLDAAATPPRRGGELNTHASGIH